MRKKRPFFINQIVKARLGFRPEVVAGNCYRVVKVARAISYSGWMVSIAPLKSNSRQLRILETLDSEYFAHLNGNHF
jgi:hypothetical protein